MFPLQPFIDGLAMETQVASDLLRRDLSLPNELVERRLGNFQVNG